MKDAFPRTSQSLPLGECGWECAPRGMYRGAVETPGAACQLLELSGEEV